MNKDLQLDPLLEELLCCPSCKGDSTLTRSDESEKLICNLCLREFSLKKVPGKNGEGILIPSLLLEG